ELEQALVRLGSLPCGAVDRSADGARSEPHDPNPLGRVLLGDALHQQHDATLRGRVVGVPGPGNHFMDRADAEDLPRCPGDLGHWTAATELANRLTSA